MGIIYNEQEFHWNVKAFVKSWQGFQWNIQPLPLNWYLVSGRCMDNMSTEEVACQTGLFTNQNCKSGQTVTRIASGRGLTDLCENLKKDFLSRPLQWQIDTIKRYSKPIYTTDEGFYERFSQISVPVSEDVVASVISPVVDSPTYGMMFGPDSRSITGTGTVIISVPKPIHPPSQILLPPVLVTSGQCETLITESWCEVPACFDFCLFASSEEKIGVATYYIYVLRHVPQGGLVFDGSAEARIIYPHYTMDGGINISGTSPVTSSAWGYTSDTSLPLVLDGASDRKSTNWNAVFNGGITLMGGLNPVYSSWHYICVGGMIAAGISPVNRPLYRYPASGSGLHFSGKSIYPGSRMYIGSGGMLLGGVASNKVPLRGFHSSGSMLIGGFAGNKSPSYHFVGSGSLNSGGEGGIKRFWVGDESAVELLGSALVRFIESYYGIGGIALGGESAYKSPDIHLPTHGGLVFGGSAQIGSSWQGVFEVPIGVRDSHVFYSTLALHDVATEPQIDMYPTTSVVTRCGYPMSLRLELIHNLADNNMFSDFLIRSNSTIPDRIFLRYHTGSNMWKTNLNYKYEQENWNLLFEFLCTDESDVDFNTQETIWIANRDEQSEANFLDPTYPDNYNDRKLGETVFKFNMIIHYRVGNTLKVTRFSTLFNSADSIRQELGRFEFPFSLDVSHRWVLSPASTMEFLIFEDGIGLFTNAAWKSYSKLNFFISETPLVLWQSSGALTLPESPDYNYNPVTKKKPVPPPYKPSPYQKIPYQTTSPITTTISTTRIFNNQ